MSREFILSICLFILLLGSVFRARNRLDDRLYAIKKIVFSENTDRTRRQAKCALREVRVLASLTHPNIVQYHCAWLELVPTEPRPHRTSSSSLKVKQMSPQIKPQDSMDQVIHFEGQSQSDNKMNQNNISPKSSTSQEEDSEVIELMIFDRIENKTIFFFGRTPPLNQMVNRFLRNLIQMVINPHQKIIFKIHPFLIALH